MPADRFTAVDFPDTYPQESVADHEVLMAFDGDSDAEAFRAWWLEQGSEVFAVWLKASGKWNPKKGA
jgi:hypothetical protein